MRAPYPKSAATPALGYRTGHWRLLVPLALALPGVLVCAAPEVSPTPLVPNLPLLIVAVWSLYLPRLMPGPMALLIGLLTDLALATPIGVHATLMAAVALLLRGTEARLGPRPFVIDWLLALPVAIGYQVLAGELIRVGGGQPVVVSLIPQAVVTWALFPAVARLSALAYRRVVEE